VLEIEDAAIADQLAAYVDTVRAKVRACHPAGCRVAALRFQGKTALITAAHAGSAGDRAARFAAEGATVVVADFDQAAAQETANGFGGVASAATSPTGPMSSLRSTPRSQPVARWTSSSRAPGSSATTCSSSSATRNGMQ